MLAHHNKRTLIAAWWSLISNLALTLLKIVIGIVGGSEVLVADGLHNAGDVIASAAAMGAMRISQRPADEDHPYGHGKAEVIGSAFVAGILAIAALYIAYHSVLSLLEPPHGASLLALLAAIVSVLWKQILYMYTIRVGVQAKSKGLIATAKDHLADVYASVAAVIGIGLGAVGGRWDVPLLAYGDPVAGILVSVLVLRMAIQMAKESIDVLMEKNVDEKKILGYKAIVSREPAVRRIDRIRGREHGHYVLVDLRISVPGELTIQQGHDISRRIKQAVMETYPEVEEVLIHLNPWYESN